MGNWASLTDWKHRARPIPAAAQEHIFERFHRGLAGENITGHGLGLNLARELARLHGGDVRLVRSDDDWTEFEVRFRLVRQDVPVLRLRSDEDHSPHRALFRQLHRRRRSRRIFSIELMNRSPITAVSRQRPRAT